MKNNFHLCSSFGRPGSPRKGWGRAPARLFPLDVQRQEDPASVFPSACAVSARRPGDARETGSPVESFISMILAAACATRKS